MADYRYNKLYYSADEAAHKLRCAKSRVHRLIRSGKLRLELVEGKWLVPAVDVDNLMDPDGPDSAEEAGQQGATRAGNTSQLPSDGAEGVSPRTGQESASRTGEGYYYTPRQAAEMLSTNLTNVDKLVRSGELAAVSVNKYRWIKAKSVEEAVKQRFGPGKLARAPEPIPSREIGRLRPDEGQNEGGRAEVQQSGDPPERRAVGASEHTREEYYTVEEVAEKLGKRQGEVWRMVFSKKLRTETVGGKRLFRKRVIDALLVTKKKPPATSAHTTTTSRGRSQTSIRASAEDSRTDSKSPATVRVSSTRDSSGYYSAEEVAARLGKDVDEVWEMVYRDQLPVVWVGGERKFPKGAVNDLLSDRGAPKTEAEGGNQVSVRPTDDNGNPSTPQSSSEPEATGPTDKPSARHSSAGEREAGQEVWMLEDELRAERERNERLDEELQQERALREQDMTQARYEIDYLEAEMENLRRNRATLSENLHEDLEEERFKRVRAENAVEQLRDDLHEEIERRIEAERALEGSDSTGDIYGRLSSGFKGVVGSLTGTVPDEGQREQDDLRSQLEGLRMQLEEERGNRLEKEELAAGLQSRLEQGEANIRETESALAAEREQRLRLEHEKGVLDEVRRLLGAEGGGQPPQPEARAEARGPHPTADEPDGQRSEALVLTTPYGRYTFDPPFPLSDQEAELLRFVAREDEMTEEQIRRLKSRRALQTLNDLLDRLEDEGANPILEVNDRYCFNRSLLQSD